MMEGAHRIVDLGCVGETRRSERLLPSRGCKPVRTRWSLAFRALLRGREVALSSTPKRLDSFLSSLSGGSSREDLSTKLAELDRERAAYREE
jgi:hypothetical protein